MAQGTLVVFEEFRDFIGDGSHDLDSDSFKIALITNATPPTAADTSPDLADYTEVSGTNYTAGGESAAATWVEVGGVATFDVADVSWTQNGAGPTDIRFAILYNTTHAGTNDAIAFIEMTTGSDISLVDGDISIAINASGVFTLT